MLRARQDAQSPRRRLARPEARDPVMRVGVAWWVGVGVQPCQPQGMPQGRCAGRAPVVRAGGARRRARPALRACASCVAILRHARAVGAGSRARGLAPRASDVGVSAAWSADRPDKVRLL